MPSTLVAFRMASAWISIARSEAAVSVEKYGLPVPAANTTTRPFSRCRMARRRMNGSATSCISMALITRVCAPCFSSASCSASALITVASMPMWSAETRSMCLGLLGHAAKEVAATHHDGDVHAQLVHFGDLGRNLVYAVLSTPKPWPGGQCFTGKFQQDAFVGGCRSWMADA